MHGSLLKSSPLGRWPGGMRRRIHTAFPAHDELWEGIDHSLVIDRFHFPKFVRPPIEVERQSFTFHLPQHVKVREMFPLHFKRCKPSHK